MLVRVVPLEEIEQLFNSRRFHFVDVLNINLVHHIHALYVSLESRHRRVKLCEAVGDRQFVKVALIVGEHQVDYLSERCGNCGDIYEVLKNILTVFYNFEVVGHLREKAHHFVLIVRGELVGKSLEHEVVYITRRQLL